MDYYCPACGYHDGILDVIYDYEAVQDGSSTLLRSGRNRNYSMWRYLPLLPVAGCER